MGIFNNDEKESMQFFRAGDIVRLRHKELENRPVMLIKEKYTKQFKDSDDNVGNLFLGMRCGWFSSDGKWQEAVFSTKDLEFYKK